ncbi:MAG: hypothetical protein EOP06_12600, partial [Proteobacteria bacterium]
CSLKKKTHKPPCKSCKKQGIGCTFYDKPQLTRGKKSKGKHNAPIGPADDDAPEVSKPSSEFFSHEDLEDMNNDEETALPREATPEIDMEDSFGNRGVLTKIKTSFAHPIKFSSLFNFAPTDSAMGTPWGIKAVKAPEAWEASHKGNGSRVLILDTGIDQEHPALKANFEKGQDFTGTSDGSDFSDHVGHGSHVAGTIAGVLDASGFSGVAPEAKILAGRVCSEMGCSNVAIATGINWGITEHADVISMSLGGMWSTPAERAAVTAAEAAGITIVAASGNDGTAKVSYPAALGTVIAVGAVDEKLVKAPFSQWGPELAVVAPGVAVISSVPLGSGREAQVTVTINGVSRNVICTTFQGAKEMDQAVPVDMVYANLGKPEDFAGLNVEGKYVLVQRGEISFLDKTKNAIAAKAAGVVVYNNAPGLIHGALTQDGSTLPVPVALIEQAVGEEMKASLLEGKPAQTSIVTLKTDYSAFDGTSMATPHVAGVVALMKAANKNLKPSEVKDILKRTAQVLGPNTANEYGAGLVNAEAAVNAAIGK